VCAKASSSSAFCAPTRRERTPWARHMLFIRSLVTIAAFAGLGLAAAYSLLTVIAACVWRMRGTPKNPGTLPPVTLLKPLCGAEPGLYEHLRSFCRQNYPLYQIVFGVRD